MAVLNTIFYICNSYDFFCVKADFTCKKMNDVNDYHLRNIIVSHKQI